MLPSVTAGQRYTYPAIKKKRGRKTGR